MSERFRSWPIPTSVTSLLLLFCCGHGVRGTDIRDYFADAPDDSLVRSLRETSGDVTELLPEGLTVRHELHWSPGPAVLLIKNSLVNETGQSISLNHFTVVDWTFPVPGGYDAFHYTPLTYRDDTWYGSSYWTGPDWTRVGKDWHQAG